MSRRASLPGAAELFRTTSNEAAPAPAAHPGVGAVPPVHEVPAVDETETTSSGPVSAVAAAPLAAAPAASRSVRTTRRMRSVADRMPTGRERHEEKITVYCSAEELLDLESARLQLRAEHGMAVDRGRIVREAVAVVLADLEAKGESSILVRRLRES